MRYKIMLCAGLVFLFSVSMNSGLRADEFTEKDLKKWEAAFMEAVKEGDKLFHSALGS